MNAWQRWMRRLMWMAAGGVIVASGCSRISVVEPDREMTAWQFATVRQNNFTADRSDGVDHVTWTDDVDGTVTPQQFMQMAQFIGGLGISANARNVTPFNPVGIGEQPNEITADLVKEIARLRTDVEKIKAQPVVVPEGEGE